ncbi:hypothetical protein [Brevibacterium spongiae]|uniref:Uncharacterized protein n=1 Tax=Brevibacterium spongiae TaxID=2909672 RepID=A0ABY5STF1_9MICO|nr:hypothetical protein [Brevibacterium spongiae]UVI36306.1 hypothetical protein L1F31_01165 [Brevibacterium spongiae]
MNQPPGPFDPSRADEPELLDVLEEAAASESPLMLLEIASTMLASVDDPNDDDKDAEELPPIPQLAVQMLEATPEETEPLVRIWAQMLDDELFRHRIAKMLPTPKTKRLPEWIRRADEIKPFRAAAVVSPVKIEETILLEISTAGRSATLAVAVDRSGSPYLEDAYLADGPLSSVVEFSSTDLPTPVDVVTLSLHDAAARLREVLEMSTHMFPPIETESWPGTRPLLEWMLAKLSDGGTGYEIRMWEPEEIEELVADFRTSPFAAALTEDEIGHAHLLFEFQINYGNNDPLRWSGTFVERLMCDLYPRKVMSPEDDLLLMPTTLAAVVRYANDRSEVDPVFTENAIAAIEDNREEYEARVRGDRPESTSDLFARLLTGTDDDTLPLSGPWSDAGDGFGKGSFFGDQASMLAEIFIGSGAEEVGGLDALQALTDEPLADEDLDTTDLTDDIVDRLTGLVPEIRRIADEVFAEPELATSALRFLTEAGRGDPAFFRRRLADRTLLAALFWIVGKNNKLFSGQWSSESDMTIGELQHHLGVSSSPKPTAEKMLHAAGHELSDVEVILGDPRFLISRRRQRIIENRDMFWDDLPEDWEY